MALYQIGISIFLQTWVALVNCQSWSQHLIAVTGSSGFVGRQLVHDLLAMGVSLRAAVHDRALPDSQMNQFKFDLKRREVDKAFLAGANVLVHLAGPAHTHGVDESLYRELLIDGARWLFESAIQSGVRRIVLVSSCKAGYEFGCEVDETQPARPTTTYGRYKLAQEAMLTGLAQQHGVETVVLRPALIYGVGAAGNLATWLRRAQSPLVPPLPKGGLRSMVSTRDMSTALQLACVVSSAAGKTYYVADGHRYKVHEIDAAIRAACGQQTKEPGPLGFWHASAWLGSMAMHCGVDIGIDLGRLAALRGDSSCSAQRIRDELGWQPKESFLELLPQMLAGLVNYQRR